MRVSIVCPVYNARPDELKAAVRSVLDQEGGGSAQIILVDDCSTDPEIVATLAEITAANASVVTVRTRLNGGPAGARNVGLEHVAEEWVGFIDADDLWPSDKLARARVVLAMRPDANWVAGGCAELNHSGLKTATPGLRCFAQPGLDPEGVACRQPELTRSIIQDGLHLGTCLLRMRAIGGLRFDPSVMYGEDILFLVKLSLCSRADRADGIGYIYRRQHESMMWSAGRLSARYATGPQAGLRDPDLRAFRREFRWALYSVYKDLAANNLINHRRVAATRFALRAWCLDPREVVDFFKFLSLLPLRNWVELARRARRYSPSEQILLDRGRELNKLR